MVCKLLLQYWINSKSQVRFCTTVEGLHTTQLPTALAAAEVRSAPLCLYLLHTNTFLWQRAVALSN